MLPTVCRELLYPRAACKTRILLGPTACIRLPYLCTDTHQPGSCSIPADTCGTAVCRATEVIACHPTGCVRTYHVDVEIGLVAYSMCQTSRQVLHACTILMQAPGRKQSYTYKGPDRLVVFKFLPYPSLRKRHTTTCIEWPQYYVVHC